MRVTRLDANGATPAGASNMIVTDGLIKLDAKVVLSSGEDFEVKNACGNLSYSYKDDDKFKRLDIGLTFIRPDMELSEMIAAGTLVVSGGNSIGYSAPAVGAGTGNGVCLEIWSKAWIGGGQVPGRTFSDAATTSADATVTSGLANFTAADVGLTITGTGIPGGTTILSVTNSTTIELSANATATATGVAITIGRPGRYFRWVFPKVKGSLGDFAIENAATQQLYNGPTYENFGIGNGPNNDWPATIRSASAYSYFRDDSIPSTATIGLQSTPAQT